MHLTCDQCGVEFERCPSLVRSEMSYCSRACYFKSRGFVRYSETDPRREVPCIHAEEQERKKLKYIRKCKKDNLPLYSLDTCRVCVYRRTAP